MEVDEWQQEYESETPGYTIGNNVFELEAFLENEVWNEIFFNFLQPIIGRVVISTQKPIPLQMLDSQFYKMI